MNKNNNTKSSYCKEFESRSKFESDKVKYARLTLMYKKIRSVRCKSTTIFEVDFRTGKVISVTDLGNI